MRSSTSRKVVPCVLFSGSAALAVAMEDLSAAPKAAPDAPFYAFLKQCHGQVCACSLLGARLGWGARAALRLAGGTGAIKARYYELGSPLARSKGDDSGKHAALEERDPQRLIVTAEGNRRQVAVRLTKRARAVGLRCRDLEERASFLPDGSPQSARLEREIEEILDWLRQAPTSELVSIEIIPRPDSAQETLPSP